MMRLHYTKPAGAWVEALPIGNGRLGAMVYGGVGVERLKLNDVTFWSGGPREWNNPQGPGVLKAVREAVFAGRYEEAERLCRGMQGPWTQSYQPLGDLVLTFGRLAAVGGGGEGGEVKGYERWLDLERGVCGARFEVGGQVYEREVFASGADGVIVMRLGTGGGSGTIDVTVELTSVLPFVPGECGAGEVVITGRAPGYVDPPNHDSARPVRYDDNGAGQPEGMRFDLRVQVEATGGEVTRLGCAVRVTGAREVVLKIGAGTSFAGFDKSPGREGVDASAGAVARLKGVAGAEYPALLSRHEADYSALFGRVKLDLGQDRAGEAITTDERVKRYAKGAADPGLEALLFQYGRYLLIASSRSGPVGGGQAANLQGMWSQEIRPPWSSNYTININAQMNYWPAESAGLPEAHEPLLKMVRELAVNGAKTARVNYGMRGWVSHHNTDIWRQTAPVGNFGEGHPVWANWAMSAPWLCGHLWEHYAFGGDRKYLSEVAWPVMKGAAEFCLDWLVEGKDGRLVTAPSSSPEMAFKTAGGGKAAVTHGATMDLQIIWDHLSNCIEACEELGIEAEFAERLREARGKLLPMKVGQRGNIQEWAEDLMEMEPHHRHVSQLYGLHPGRQITPESGELFAAARRTLELRGDDGTGWSIGWKINFWARLRDGDHAHDLFKYILRPVGSDQMGFGLYGGVYANLFDAHPPFQIDGNFGYTAGVAEMLVQSHVRVGGEYVVELLPALPGRWARGSVSGLRARGGLVADVSWGGGKLSRAVVRGGPRGGKGVVRWGGKEVRVELEAGREQDVTAELL